MRRVRVRAWLAGLPVALALATAVAAAILGLAPRAAYADAFADWLADLRVDAVAQGIRPAVFDRAMAGVRPLPAVIELDQRQPEFTQTFWNYLDKRVTDERIARGRSLLVTHADLLASVARRYGVQPRFIVAFWGLETNYGGYTGETPLFAALATLAWDPRRRDFFRQQIFAALEGVQRGDIPYDARSSWAGAFGQPQFMPTTYRDFAVDGDGDGVRNLWTSLPDVFASAANYLAASGWSGDETWGREVLLPRGFDYTHADLAVRQPLDVWRRLGVRRIDGGPLPVAEIAGAIILPGGATDGPAILAYGNFSVIMTWNRSLLYAVAVGHLSDRLAGGGPFLTPRPQHEVALSRAEVMEMQRLLDALGYATGGVDGVVGSGTRRAIRNFQQQAAVPADGYPTPGLLRRLRTTAGQ